MINKNTKKKDYYNVKNPDTNLLLYKYFYSCFITKLKVKVVLHQST